MAITRVQNWTSAAKSNGTGSTVTNTLVSVPTAGNLLVAFLGAGDAGGAITLASFDDNIGDSVSWAPFSANPLVQIGSNNRIYGYYKVVGTPSGGTKAVQCTITGTQALGLFVAEYGIASGSPTWTIDGSQISAAVASAGPANAGNVTTTGTDDVLIGFASSDGPMWNAGTGFTRQATSNVWANYSVEDQLVTTPGTYAIDWSAVGGVAAWTAFGISFNAAAGGGGPSVTTVSSNSATEGSSIVHTVTLSAAVTGSAASYAITLAGGTATGGGTDYTSTLSNGMFSDSVTVSGGNISVPVGVSTFTVTVSTAGDTIDEANETYTLTIGGTAGTGTINDDDAAPTITGTTSQTVTAGSPVVITYSPGLSGQTRTYTLALTDGTATGGTDYDNTTVTGDFAVTAGTGSVSISGSTVTVDPGVTEFTLTITTTA